MNSVGLTSSLAILVPQFDMQPFSPGGAVPGFPAGPVWFVQYLGVIPHWPQILQQTLSGQGLRAAMAVPLVGISVPGTVGPHTEFAIALGIGGSPVLRQMLKPMPRP